MEVGSTRRELLAASAALAAAGALPAQARGRRRPKPPNVIVILADDLGYGALGAYGQKTLKTPNLDRLAREGLRFTNGYTASPQCAPSRACLLTGLHNGHARIRSNAFTTEGGEPQFEPEDVTLGTVMKAAGMRTGVFGKWGFGNDSEYPRNSIGAGLCAPSTKVVDVDPTAGTPDPSHPLQQGFDEFVGLIAHHHATEGYYADYVWDGNTRVPLPENAGEERGTFVPDVYVDRALQFIERNRRKPFFMMLTPQLPHWPSVVPSVAPYEDELWPDAVKRLAAQFTLLDTYVGQVRDQLERLGLDRNTLILFSSDNGPTPEERLLFGSGGCTDESSPSAEQAAYETAWETDGGLRGSKHSLYEGGIRVPLIAWGPGVVRTDSRAPVDRPWTLSDVLPTLADLTGIRPPSDCDGVSVRRWITGEGRRRRRPHPPLYWERPPYTAHTQDNSPPVPTTYGEAARSGRWKLVRYAPGTDPDAPDAEWTVELYDLSIDPVEANDVAADHPEVVERLLAIVRASHAPEPYARAPWKPRRTRTGFDTRA